MNAIPPYRRGSGPLGWLLCVTSLIWASGCIDAHRLIEKRRREALKWELDEVDLGHYRVVLPQLPGESRGGVVSFHAFGRVAMADRKAVDRKIEAQGPALQHNMLMAIREIRPDDLRDPHLQGLRDRVAKVINSTLDGDLVRGVGFYEFAYTVL